MPRGTPSTLSLNPTNAGPSRVYAGVSFHHFTAPTPRTSDTGTQNDSSNSVARTSIPTHTFLTTHGDGSNSDARTTRPTHTDLFGKQGLEWLHNLQLPTPDHEILQSSLQVVETLNEQIRSMDIQIAKDATTEEQAKLLMTMPGVDYYAAMVLLSEFGDEKLVSWVGLAPQVHQSGGTQWTGHISRKGSKRARWILGQCAQSARQHDPRMREFYERIQQKHGPSKAIVAVARKMLAIMYVMLIRNEPYHGEKPELTEQKHKRLDTLANNA